MRNSIMPNSIPYVMELQALKKQRESRIKSACSFSRTKGNLRMPHYFRCGSLTFCPNLEKPFVTSDSYQLLSV